MPVELTAEEREAFRRAFASPFDDLGPAGICTCDSYPLPIEDHGDECAVRALYEGWVAGLAYHKADSEVSVRMLADALKELIDWVEYGVDLSDDFAVEDPQALLGEARAALDALNEPVETPRDHAIVVAEIPKKELSGGNYTRFQAACKLCEWNGPVRASRTAADHDGEDHLAHTGAGVVSDRADWPGWRCPKCERETPRGAGELMSACGYCRETLRELVWMVKTGADTPEGE